MENLKKLNYIDHDQIDFLDRLKIREDFITKIINLRIIPEDILYQVLADVIGYPYKVLKDERILQDFSSNFYLKTQSVVISQRRKNFLVMADPLDLVTKSYIKQNIKIDNIFLGSPSNLVEFIQTKCSTVSSIESFDVLLDILLAAVLKDASDIHFQVEESFVTVKFRVQGILRKHVTLTLSEWTKILVRLKIKGNLDIAESRRPQGGSFYENLSGKLIDFRISTHPVIYGENVVLRILEKNKVVKSIETLGFEPDQITTMKKFIRSNFGLIVICGPTGSGKTTTLYSLFTEINNGERNVMTLEEPVEYKISGVRQSEIIHDDIMSYADGIKSMLRQDPDVIFIGEIRDENTAKMAIRASITGHLVIATLHTFDAVSVIYRLLDLGISEKFLSVSLLGVVSQRLIRFTCENCSGKGCKQCYGDGLFKRNAIGEILEVTPEIRSWIAQGDDVSHFRGRLSKSGFLSIKDIAMQKVVQNLTTTDEVKRVLD